MVHPGYRKRTIFLLIGILLLRFWFGQTFELSGQEAYIWLEGHGTNLSSSYWERGPFVPWLTRVGTLFFGDTEMGVRWISAVICCTSGFILFYLARHWFNARAAFWTVVLFLILPMYAWKLSFMTEAAASTGLMALTLLAFSRAVEEDKIWWWLMGGAACGLALLVALPNAWWIVGLLLYFGVNAGRRPRLREVFLWITIVFTSLFLLPIISWWRGSQVADLAHTHILNTWPLSHSPSVDRGFEFIWKEIFYLSPCFFVLMTVVFWQLGRQVWNEPRYGLLVCLAVPGLVWENFSAFFHEGRFELMPGFFLPLTLLVGCYAARVTLIDRTARWFVGVVFVLALLQSLAGLNPFYLASRTDGRGDKIHRTHSGENVTSFYADKRQISWRNLADVLQRLQQEQGATLIITDSPETASALSFYLPHNQFVYVESRQITHFDFWPHYDESASPNDSAIYVTRSNDTAPPQEIVKNFASVEPIQDPPFPEFDKAWNMWSCQKFIGSGQATHEIQATPMPEHDALPK